MALTLLLSVAFLSVTHADISGPNVKTGTVGRQVEIICRFNTFFSNYQKYWCKGYYRRSCAILVQTQGPEMKSGDGRITITADNEKGQLTIRMDRLTKNDRGWYWCGIERPHLLDPLSPVELKVHEGQKLLPSDKERLRFFIILGLVFGILTMMFLGLLVLVIKKIRKNKNDDKKERESTIENSIPKSNSVLSKEKEAGVTYATVMIQPTDHPQQDSTTYDNVNPSNSQEENKPPVTEPPTSEPIEYSTIVFKK
ncbi:CMRF35-like molecule 1 isoform X2 [Pristis pectinata]|uniref:CMRF35-like molecule 1 isoform X2 n=1 Tax=Pristis pectinata TaxID=685728 RepID=UPI00223D390A|nr:CMRF35-like molecule 1 isoform X2 [Pristis pectinata]